VISVVGVCNNKEETMLDMYSKFSKDGSNVISLDSVKLKNLKEFKLIVQSADDNSDLENQIEDCKKLINTLPNLI
jgi:hypothetical protein